MTIRPRFAALIAFASFGCSEPPPPPAASGPVVSLSTDNPEANAAAIATFFRKTCLDSSGDAGAFTAALQNSGWEPEQVQVASSTMPIAAWRLDHGDIVRSAISLGPGTNFIDCELELDAEVAPSLGRMSGLLRPIINQPSLREMGGGPTEVKWRWRAGPREERELTIGRAATGPGSNEAGDRPRLSLHLGTTETNPPPSPAANETVPAENENVQ
jgi:hypothetical protein